MTGSKIQQKLFLTIFFVLNLENLSPPKKLRGGVKFVETLPQTVTGKLDRKELKKWARGA